MAQLNLSLSEIMLCTLFFIGLLFFLIFSSKALNKAKEIKQLLESISPVDSSLGKLTACLNDGMGFSNQRQTDVISAITTGMKVLADSQQIQSSKIEAANSNLKDIHESIKKLLSLSEESLKKIVASQTILTKNAATTSENLKHIEDNINTSIGNIVALTSDIKKILEDVIKIDLS